MNKTACGVIRSFLTQNLKYDMINGTSANLKDSSKQVLDEEHRELLALKRRLYRYQLKGRFSISDHINNYTSFLQI